MPLLDHFKQPLATDRPWDGFHSTWAGTMATLAWPLTSRWSVGLLAAGFFLTQNLTALLWAPLHRVDPLALGLTLLGLALATAGNLTILSLTSA